MTQNTKHIIGIAGNALVGKDTLCNALIYTFKKLYKLTAVRRSIAGDRVRRDLKPLITEKFGIDIESPTNEEKTLLRPIMVEYGRVQRQITNGRYFIDSFVPSEFIDIVPDIRYAEYEKDELYWITKEKNGFLIYLEREGVEPANVYEEYNNKIVKAQANCLITMPTFPEYDIEAGPRAFAEGIIREWFKAIKL